MQCPVCKLTNPDQAVKCDCGWDFQTQRMGSSLSGDDTWNQGMTGGEWFGVLFFTPYAIFKYFQWKGRYPRKANQVRTFLAIALALNIGLILLRVAAGV